MSGWFPISNRSNLFFVHIYLPWAHNMANVLFTWFTTLTLLKFGLQLMLPQSLENKPHMIFMLIFSGTEYKYIIQVHEDKVINVLPHNTIHQPLKG